MNDDNNNDGNDNLTTPQKSLSLKFKHIMLKSIKSPSPLIVNKKRKLNDLTLDNDEINNINELPRKRLRSSSPICSNSDNTNEEENLINDQEFNDLFEIIQNNDASNDDNDNDNSTQLISNVGHRRRRLIRYFDNNDDNNNNNMSIMNKKQSVNITFKCYNCGEVGHIARNCSYPSISICFKCGESGHSGFYCINNICSFCLKKHQLNECNLLRQNKNIFKFCLRCGSSSHYLNQCDIILNKRISSLQCYVCGKFGHLNCKSNIISKKIILCSNCGNNNHTVYFCPHLKMNKSEIAIGLQTSNDDPRICFQCLLPDHDARNCPLTIRQKQQRKKNNKLYHYNSNSVNKYNKNKNKNKKYKKYKNNKNNKNWRKESIKLIHQYKKNKNTTKQNKIDFIKRRKSSLT